MPTRARKRKTSLKHDTREAWLIIVSIFLVSAGIISYSQKKLSDEILANSASLESMAIPKEQRIWIEFDSGTDIRTFEGIAAGHSRTLAEELATLSKDAEVPLRVQNDVLTEFDHIKNKIKQWKIYKRNENISAPLSQLVVTRGDRYTFKYER